jgi:hypothetical protein
MFLVMSIMVASVWRCLIVLFNVFSAILHEVESYGLDRIEQKLNERLVDSETRCRKTIYRSSEVQQAGPVSFAEDSERADGL